MHKRVLVTGGAGYIGAYVRDALNASNIRSAVFDHFHNNSIASIQDAQVFKGDITDIESLQRAIGTFQPDAVIHLASLSEVRATKDEQGVYRKTNIGGAENLLRVIEGSACQIVFASSASVYRASAEPRSESSCVDPISMYSKNKLEVEGMLAASPAQSTCLRITVAAGQKNGVRVNISDVVRRRLVPIIARSVVFQEPAEILVFGNDLPTSDGSCVRDYVHVTDVASAFVEAIGAPTESPHRVINIGTGKGTSVLQALGCASSSYPDLKWGVGPSNPNDAYSTFVQNKVAEIELGWRPKITSFADILRSEVQYYQQMIR